MKHCRSCKIDVDTSRITCPLCFDILEEKNDTKVVYTEAYQSYKERKKGLHLAQKIIIFISIIAFTVCAIINYMTFDGSFWSLIVLGSIVYLWVLVNTTILTRRNIAFKMILQAITISILLGFIQLQTKEVWLIPYALPFIMISTVFAITLLILIKTMRYKDYMLYLIVMIILGIIPSILLIINSTKFLFLVNDKLIIWPSIACGLYAIFTFLGMFIFGNRATKDEFKKRFHI